MSRYPQYSRLAALLLGITFAFTGAVGLSANQQAPLGIGDNAWTQPSIPLPALDGEQYPLEHWRGKVVLLNFWASWCAPCQYEIPELVKLQEKYGPEGLQIIGIGVDRERALRNVARSLGINYPVLVAEVGRGTELLLHWGNTSQTVPYNVVIDRDGRILFTQHGQFDQGVFREHISPLLDQN